MPIRASQLLPSIGHAASGAGGTVVSTLATYPLDLVNTRLKAQRQLKADGTIQEEDAYSGVLDAFATIYNKEGGLSAFFAGLGSDLAKSAADSFLFFLFYTWFRARRLRARNDARYLRAAEELAVGAAAGMCAKLFTTPVSNVVTRKQMASLLLLKNSPTSPSPSSSPTRRTNPQEMTFTQIISEIRRERGVLGLWAGYSASLVLTLNPSLTFFLQQFLKRLLVPRRDWDDPPAQTTFLLAAISKSFATTVTYPFQIAKARVQVSSSPKSEEHLSGIERKEARKRRETEQKPLLVSLVGDTIFATVFRIGKEEGVKALYDGIGGELFKAFFNHGTTMLFKDIIHRFLVKAYFAVLVVVRSWPLIRMLLMDRIRRLKRTGGVMKGRAEEACKGGFEGVTAYASALAGLGRHALVGLPLVGGTHSEDGMKSR